MLVGGSDNMVANAVKHLRAKGLLVALDDFGTGFASLTHLLTFPVDIIKIDRSFVDRLTGDPSSGVIVAGLIDIARKLGMRTVAEGIETPEQAARLQEFGCTARPGLPFLPARGLRGDDGPAARPCARRGVADAIALDAGGRTGRRCRRRPPVRRRLETLTEAHLS